MAAGLRQRCPHGARCAPRVETAVWKCCAHLLLKYEECDILWHRSQVITYVGLLIEVSRLMRWAPMIR